MENEQINVIMENEGLTPAQFASAIGIQRAQVSHLQNNRNHVSLDVVKRIHAAFPNISPEWLLTGMGNYYVDGTSVLKTSPSPMPSLDEKSLFDEMEQKDAPVAPQKPSENRKKTSEDAINSDFCKGDVAEWPQNSTQITQKQCADCEIKQRKILEIKVFYDDGTYETFCRR